jgi:rhamnose utilization protein RhaD (predicted bifunctional aldolase and dehydrogenase)
VNFVGHTHPISVNRILCSQGWYDCTKGRLFPDEIVCCGIAPAHVEYVDPGVTLARRIKEVVTDYIKEHGERPKAVWPPSATESRFALGRRAHEAQRLR